MKHAATTLLAAALAACGAAPAPVPMADAPAGPTPGVPSPTAPVAESAREAPAAPASEAPRRALRLPGSFSPATTRADLERDWGAANVRAGDVPGAEGAVEPGFILHPDDPARRAWLYLDDAGRLATVRIFDPGSRWTLDNGIGIGTPVAELVRLNGGPFRFMGMGWDYGGWIFDWRGGRLAQAEDAPVRRRVRLELGEAAATGDAPMPVGDGEFDSDDPRWPALDARVGELAVDFAGAR